MSYSKTALRRAWFSFALASPTTLARALRKIRERLKYLNHPKPPLSDHLARDIGLSPTELELVKLHLPSQHTHHPYG
ncbi:hypothetical protein [Shimia sp. MMG029]|uniref:hypothetical protein n=1 Tax=Shimia sp. MMG029 TaxID=3021978 RepID=UPI0022FE47F8|nr:hypothetical protein [Shimia sp. MMG029]MDA5557250.1 hypothetical protein [Shimia sp. MMG029]